MAWLLMSTRSTLCSTTSSSFFFAITNRLLGRSTANPCTSLLSCKDRPDGQMELGWMLACCFEPFRGNGDEWGAQRQGNMDPPLLGKRRPGAEEPAWG